MLYQAAGNFASTFAITDLFVSGTFGSSREKIVPAWNQKFWMDSAAEVRIELAQ